MSNKNTIRIRTTPNGSDTYIKTEINHDFDFIEILSLKISQDKVYQKFSSDYGVVVGRVYANSGFGIPNARVSIFIPIDEEDKNNPEIASLYPFEVVTDKDSDGVRYNLLPKESDNMNDCYTPIGTFSAKREILDNDIKLKIYDKYYRYTTVTNSAGDFMLFGVPVGNYTIHVDADISNIGLVSQRPYDLIAKGMSDKMFDSSTKFKYSTNLDSLPQVKTINTGVNVLPFWGDIDNFEIGISRIDVDINYQITPTAIFMGSIFGDSEKNSVNKNCRPRNKMGSICETTTGGGTVEMIRKTFEGGIEEYNVEGGRVIDNNGAWAYQIPMNLDYMVTDEFGNLVLTEDQTRGIPTRTRVRFRVGMDETGGLGRLRTRAKFLIPHNPDKFEDRDFSFDKTTKDSSFVDLYWNKIYSVKSFIPRIQNSGGVDNRNTLGMKDLNNCSGDKNPFPYNRLDTNVSPIFSVICIIVSIISFIISLLNDIICTIKNIGFLGIHPFKKVVNVISLKCPSDTPRNYIVGGKRCGGVKAEVFVDCLSAVLAQDLNVFQFDFYNDWINGTLYSYSLKYKRKRKGNEKYCEYDCDDFPDSIDKNNCNSKLLLDSCTGSGVSPSDNKHAKTFNTISLSDGFISKYNDILYYSPIIHRGKYKLFATDIISLGSILDCDWQGTPKIQEYLTPTSFKIPPILTETEKDEIVCGMVNVTNNVTGNGVFFTINCSGVHLDEGNCSNIKKICEIGSDLPSGDCIVGMNDIYDLSDPTDVINNVNKFVRNMFYGLNVKGTSTFYFPNIISSDNADPKNGTSFNITNTKYKQLNGAAYNEFRNYFPSTQRTYQQPLGGSFFFYFGLLPGKTALNKMNAKFFTKCERVISEDFLIESSVQPISKENESDGRISFSFIGGIEPYTYTWSGINYNPPSAYGSSGSIDGLSMGDYKISVVDAVGTVQEKIITVGLPQALTAYLQIMRNSTTPTSNDGQVLVYSIVGGSGPFTLKFASATNELRVMSIKSGDIISGIPTGINTFTITDSSTPVQTFVSVLEIKSPDKLFVSIEVTDPTICGEDGYGSISAIISGGTKPYNIKTTNSSGEEIDIYLEQYLLPGNYTVVVTDSGMQTVSDTVTIKNILPPVAIVTTQQILWNQYRHEVKAKYGFGTPPYTGTGVFVDNNKTITVSITDSNGCESEEVTG